MIISDEQIRRALEYLKSCGPHTACPDAVRRFEDEVVLRAIAVAMSAPDVRPERLEQARYVTEGFLPDAESVADKLIGRAISDSLR